MSDLINFKSIQNCIDQKRVFAAYQLPHESQFKLLISKKKEARVIDNIQQIDHSKGFIIHPFSSSKHPILFIEPDFYLKQGTQSNVLSEMTSVPDISSKQKNILATSKEEYKKQLTQFLNEIHEGNFEKLVLSRIQSEDRNEKSLSSTFEALTKAYPSHFNYILYTPQSGLWMGSSPEVLYQEKENNAHTVALAGTQVKTSNNPNDYQWNPKEIEEQKFVIDYIENLLENHVGKKFSKTNESYIAGNVVHLKSSFQFNKEDIISRAQLINDLHPTPAVCGIPKEKAQSYIEELESHDREYYSGFLGPYNIESECNLFVNLRCLKADDQSFHLYIGGGITKDSVLEDEWLETMHKAQTLLAHL